MARFDFEEDDQSLMSMAMVRQIGCFVAMINVFHNCRAQSFWLRKAFVLKSLARHKGGLNQRS